MDQKIEIKKIKVSNGQELINKAREYKNLGGEWKLLERCIEMANGITREENLGWGIIISNSEQTIDIRSTRNNVGKNGPNDEIGVRDQLHQIFPEAKGALFANRGT